MTIDHVYDRFQNYIEAIQTLLQRDTTFKEICVDYEEICNWLEDHCRSQSRLSEECDRAREIIRDLEEEIHQVLREHGF